MSVQLPDGIRQVLEAARQDGVHIDAVEWSAMQSAKTHAGYAPMDANKGSSDIHERPPQHPAAAVVAAIQWAGNLGRIAGHDAQYSRGVPDPVYFAQDAVGHEAMVLTAEIYAPGFSDAIESDLSALRAEVDTDFGAQPGAVRALALDPKVHARRMGNNLRLLWDVGDALAVATPGEYKYQFRFSLDGRQWVTTPQTTRRLVIAARTNDIPPEALIESSVLLKVGEISASRIGWLGTPMLRTDSNQTAQPLPAETYYEDDGRAFLEIAVQVWAPGVSNRADLTPEEHSFALRQLGVRVESPFLTGGGFPLRFGGKAGIHEHDDIARFNLAQYVAELRSQGLPTPRSGKYLIEIVAGDKRIGAFTLHWVKAG